MSRLLLILRWIGAVFVAFMVFCAVYGLGAVIWQHFGTNVVRTVELSIFAGMCLAIMSGVLVVPREQRKTAALVLWMLAVALSLWPLLLGHLTAANIHQTGLVAAGGFGPYYLARSGLFAGRKINRVSKQNS